MELYCVLGLGSYFRHVSPESIGGDMRYLDYNVRRRRRRLREYFLSFPGSGSGGLLNKTAKSTLILTLIKFTGYVKHT